MTLKYRTLAQDRRGQLKAMLAAGRKLRAIDEYTRWCSEHGFAATTDKHWRSLEEEKRAHDEEQRKRKERARLARNPRRVVQARPH